MDALHGMSEPGADRAVTSTFTDATVTAVNPLRIRLDGDTAILPFPPDSLVDSAGLMVGDRVRCELSSRRVIIVGRAGGGDGSFIGEHKAGEWATSPSPSWVLANGAILNIADYPRLAAHYAATYGAANHHGGNGTTTFAVPDTRERTYVNQGGADIFATIGGKTGTKTHTLTTAEMPAHAHDQNVAVSTGGSASMNTDFDVFSNTSRVAAGLYATQSAGGGTAHNNVQPSFVCRYVIRAA